MDSPLPTKELLMAVIEKDGSLLMRKKPVGSPPYKETWYSFGCEAVADQDDVATIKRYLKDEIGIEVKVNERPILADGETKPDHNGVMTAFTYTNFLCAYISGMPQVPAGAERVEWIPKDKLSDYDIVPPSMKLFASLGYIGPK